MRRLFLSLVLVSAILGAHRAVTGQVPGSDGQRDVGADRIARLIKRLGNSSYDSRQTAGEELERLGSLTRTHLEAAIEDEDPEIRLRAKELLRKLKVQDLWAPSRVNHQAQGQMASEVLGALAQQTGNRVLVGDQYGKFEDRPVDLDYVDTPFWIVMDALCHRSGNPCPAALRHAQSGAGRGRRTTGRLSRCVCGSGARRSDQRAARVYRRIGLRASRLRNNTHISAQFPSHVGRSVSPGRVSLGAATHRSNHRRRSATLRRAIGREGMEFGQPRHATVVDEPTASSSADFGKPARCTAVGLELDRGG